MPKQRNYQLSDEQLKELEVVIDQNRDARIVKKALALRMLHQGMKATEVATQLRVTRASLYNWCERWQREGRTGLVPRSKPGRPRKATPVYQQQLEAALEQEPADYGYSFTVWTLERLRDHLEQQTGIHLSTGRFAALLAEQGYVYRRPKAHLAAKQNTDAKAKASALLEELKKEQHTTIASFSLWTKRP